MNKEGTITVGAEAFDLDPHFVRVAVADTGGALDAETLSTIFEWFDQPRNAAYSGRQGLGIRLHICEELVARQTGRIWVESQPGYGITFFFTLPTAHLPHKTAAASRL